MPEPLRILDAKRSKLHHTDQRHLRGMRALPRRVARGGGTDEGDAFIGAIGESDTKSRIGIVDVSAIPPPADLHGFEIRQ